jgi:hypothetical protein
MFAFNKFSGTSKFTFRALFVCQKEFSPFVNIERFYRSMWDHPITYCLGSGESIFSFFCVRVKVAYLTKKHFIFRCSVGSQQNV